MTPLDIHDFLEYRPFLRQAIEREKTAGRITGQRDVALFLGLKSSGHISWILQGKRNLSPRLVQRIAQMLSLSQPEEEYFGLLVDHNDSENPDDRRRLMAAISRIQSSRKRRIVPGKVAYLSSWKHATVRELLALGSFRKSDAEALGQQLLPTCETQDVRDSLQLLEELDLVAPDEEGILHRTDSVVTAGADCSPEAVRSFQDSILELSRQALRNIPREERHITTITFSASPERFQKIRTRIQEMRQEILTLIRTDPSPSVVYHLSIQAFPASRPFGQPHE